MVLQRYNYNFSFLSSRPRWKTSFVTTIGNLRGANVLLLASKVILNWTVYILLLVFLLLANKKK